MLNLRLVNLSRCDALIGWAAASQKTISECGLWLNTLLGKRANHLKKGTVIFLFLKLTTLPGSKQVRFGSVVAVTIVRRVFLLAIKSTRAFVCWLASDFYCSTAFKVFKRGQGVLSQFSKSLIPISRSHGYKWHLSCQFVHFWNYTSTQTGIHNHTCNNAPPWVENWPSFIGSYKFYGRQVNQPVRWEWPIVIFGHFRSTTPLDLQLLMKRGVTCQISGQELEKSVSGVRHLWGVVFSVPEGWANRKRRHSFSSAEIFLINHTFIKVLLFFRQKEGMKRKLMGNLELTWWGNQSWPS